MKTLISYFLAAVTAFFGSCCPKDTPVQPRVVTGITVCSDTEPEQVLRRYTSADKMHKLLNYIRILQPHNPAADPAPPSDRSYRIRLNLSDGSEILYRQRENRLFQSDGDIWREIDPERAIRLELILYAVPSD